MVLKFIGFITYPPRYYHFVKTLLLIKGLYLAHPQYPLPLRISNPFNLNFLLLHNHMSLITLIIFFHIHIITHLFIDLCRLECQLCRQPQVPWFLLILLPLLCLDLPNPLLIPLLEEEDNFTSEDAPLSPIGSLTTHLSPLDVEFEVPPPPTPSLILNLLKHLCLNLLGLIALLLGNYQRYCHDAFFVHLSILYAFSSQL